MTSTTVGQLQQLLNKFPLGLPKLRVDNNHGAKTAEAVHAFMAYRGLSDNWDGAWVDNTTWALLQYPIASAGSLNAPPRSTGNTNNTPAPLNYNPVPATPTPTPINSQLLIAGGLVLLVAIIAGRS